MTEHENEAERARTEAAHALGREIYESVRDRPEVAQALDILTDATVTRLHADGYEVSPDYARWLIAMGIGSAAIPGVVLAVLLRE